MIVKFDLEYLEKTLKQDCFTDEDRENMNNYLLTGENSDRAAYILGMVGGFKNGFENGYNRAYQLGYDAGVAKGKLDREERLKQERIRREKEDNQQKEAEEQKRLDEMIRYGGQWEREYRERRGDKNWYMY